MINLTLKKLCLLIIILEITVHSGDFYDHRFTVDKLLTYSAKEIHSTFANYWLAPNSKSGVGFILDLGETKIVDNIFLTNCRNGRYRDRATKDFHVYLSIDGHGPWTKVLEDTLPDERREDSIRSKSYKIHPTRARFVRFLLISYWGRGGGLQYFTVNKEIPQFNIQLDMSVNTPKPFNLKLDMSVRDHKKG